MVQTAGFRKSAVLAALLTCAAIAVSGLAAPPRASGWLKDMKTAEAEAKRLNRPILIHFYAEWCGPCKKMEAETLNSPDVVRQLGTRFVGVKINTDLNRELAKQFNVESLPSDVIVAPDGRVLAQTIGYQDQGSYLTRLARVDARYESDRKVMVTKQGPAPRPGDQLHPLDNEPEPRRSGGEAAFIGLNGYSPVSLYYKRDWIKGRKEHAATYDGVVYHFLGAEERAEFEENPEKFSPRILGCDPVVLSETERAIPGSTRFGAYSEGRLFLFVSSATRDQFKQEPEKFAAQKQTVRADQIEYRRSP